MDKKRVFECRVSMPCTLDQYKKDLREQLVKLGYDSLDKYEGLTGGPRQEYMQSLQVNWERSQVSWYTDKIFESDGMTTLDHYNPELFLALAAISEGPDLWPGELVVAQGTTVEVKIGDVFTFSEYSVGSILIKELPGIAFGTNWFRKATATELINHFQLKQVMQQTEDKLFHLGQKVVVADHIHTITGYDPADKVYFLKSRLGSESKHYPSEIEPLIREKDGSVELPGYVVQANPDTAVGVERMTIVNNPVNEFKPYTPIWVWNEKDGMRTKMLFAFASETTIFAFEPQFETWSNFEIHEYKYWAHIDEPVSVLLEEVKKRFASIYGVPAELIQIQG